MHQAAGMLPKRPRLRAFDYTGLYRYFLTFCTHQRRPVFADADAIAPVLAQILRTAERCQFAVHAYVFMVDHVHLLVEGTDDSADLREFVKLAKQHTGYAHASAGRGRLWQPSYFERVLREHESTRAVIAYIMNNPVRAGYTTAFGEYRYAGSATVPLESIAELLRDDPEATWQP